MATIAEVRLDISGYAEGTGTELSLDLMRWLRMEARLSGESEVRIGRQYPEVTSLEVTLSDRHELAALAGALVTWMRVRRPSSDITIRVSIQGLTETAVLGSGASDAEIMRFLATATPDSIVISGGSVHIGALAQGPGARVAYSDETPVASPATPMMPVTIYLSDEAIHEQVEAAVEVLLASAGLQIEIRDDPIAGSWFRRMRAAIKEAARSPAAREATLVAAHMIETRLVLAQDAAVTATLLQNLAPVLTSLQPTKDAAIRAGALLIVKVDWTVHVFQLTAAQQAMLAKDPKLARSPHEIITALDLKPDDDLGDRYPELE